MSFFPLSKSQEKVFTLKKPNVNPDVCWTRGNRRKSLVALIGSLFVSEQLIREINKWFFNPPKGENELNTEILTDLEKKQSYFYYIDNLKMYTEVDLIFFEPSQNQFFLRNKDTRMLEKKNQEDLKIYLSSFIEAENLQKYWSKYLNQLQNSLNLLI